MKTRSEDLQELTDIRRSVSRAEPNLENELEDLRNELKDEIDMINDNVKKIKEDKTKKYDNLQSEINQLLSLNCSSDQPEMSIDHDLIESVETNMKTHVEKKLDNYVQVAEIDDMIANALARGFSPSQATALPTQQSLRQLKQELSASFVLKSDFDSKLEQMDFDKPLPAPPLPTSKPPSVRTVTDVSINDEWKQYVQATLKQYVSAADIHGLIHEVQRISESHKTIMNEKSDTIRRLDSLEAKQASQSVVLHIASDSSDEDIKLAKTSTSQSKEAKFSDDQTEDLKVLINQKMSKNEFNQAFSKIKHDMAEKLKQFVGIKDIHGLSKF